jgi:hypothetical protein
MSVPVKDRHESQIQYSYATWEAYHDISRFVLKLSPKLQSLFGQLLVESSQQIVTLTVEASEINYFSLCLTSVRKTSKSSEQRSCYGVHHI